MKFSLTHKELKAAERSVYSQGGQDGVLEAIFNQIGCGNKRFVEFGARDGVELSNTANLRINYGWNGLLMDLNPLSEWVRKERVSVLNINYLLAYYKYTEVDYISLDIDGNDGWVWLEMSVLPRVVSVEFNSKFNNRESLMIEYNENHVWDGDDYYSGSLLALKKIGNKKGYKLVYAVDRFDAIFVRNDEVDAFFIEPTLDEIFPHPIIAHSIVSNKKWVEV